MNLQNATVTAGKNAEFIDNPLLTPKVIRKRTIVRRVEGFIRIKVLPLFEERHLLLSKKGAAFYRNKSY